MQENALLPHLFRTEYRKIVSVLCSLFGIEHIEVAEDIVSDTFLSATELWGLKGLPENPVAWLYTVAKNKTRNYLKRNTLFAEKLVPEIKHNTAAVVPEPDLSVKSIEDSQLAMIFTVCNPCITAEAQVALALNLLCGFGTQEIADAFLTSKDVIYKRLSRAREKLKAEKIRIVQPAPSEVDERLDTVLTTLYLLFNEGYYSVSRQAILRQELCAEAMRLCYMLADDERTGRPAVHALLALMCFHASRFAARVGDNGEAILYNDQDTSLWNDELIRRGVDYLNRASRGAGLTRYHLEAGIAFWHTQQKDAPEKWEHILQLYNQLLLIEYSPIAALNRTYALAKANGREQAIAEALKLGLEDNPFYHSLLGNLYTGLDNTEALLHYEAALELARSDADKATIRRNIQQLRIG